jgi:hypothetical protein
VEKSLYQKTHIIAVVLLLAALFYWFQWRPSEIFKLCQQNATGLTLEDMKNQSDLNTQNGITQTTVGDTAIMNKEYADDYNLRYEQCLRENGLSGS